MWKVKCRRCNRCSSIMRVTCWVTDPHRSQGCRRDRCEIQGLGHYQDVRYVEAAVASLM